MSRRDPMHSFPLHVADWIGSEAIQTLNAAGEHAYLRLCLNQWKNEDDGLPSDPSKLRLFTKLSPKEWAAAWDALSAYFPTDPDGKRRNPRVERERQFMLALREARRTNGIKGNEKRWNEIARRSLGDRNRIANASQNDRPSPSPSPTQNYSSSGAVNCDSKKQLAMPAHTHPPRGRSRLTPAATLVSDLLSRIDAQRGAA